MIAPAIGQDRPFKLGTIFDLGEVLMADDVVVTHIKQHLLRSGFTKKKSVFCKRLAESVAEIQIQNCSYDKRQHFINVTIKFDDEVRDRESFDDPFGIFYRAESLNQAAKHERIRALDAGVDMDETVRQEALDAILRIDLEAFLDAWATFAGARAMFETGVLEFAAVNHQLKARWSSDAQMQSS